MDIHEPKLPFDQQVTAFKAGTRVGTGSLTFHDDEGRQRIKDAIVDVWHSIEQGERDRRAMIRKLSIANKDSRPNWRDHIHGSNHRR